MKKATLIISPSREQGIQKLRDLIGNKKAISVKWSEWMENGDLSLQRAEIGCAAIAICDMPDGDYPEFVKNICTTGLFLKRYDPFKRIEPEIFITTTGSYKILDPIRFKELIDVVTIQEVKAAA